MPHLLAGPAAEPLTPADLKAFLRVTHDAEDGLLALLITTARQMVESAAGRILLRQSWRFVFDSWPAAGLLVPALAPVEAILAARLRHADGGESALAPDLFTLRGDRAPALIAFDPPRMPRPDRALGGIELDLALGYGAAAAAVPADLVQAVRLFAAHLYERRDEAGGDALPSGVAALLAPYARVRL
ncbi:head-tail connector protein [Aquabacter spiritensis]|uniref:Putative phiE125 gp8 family phage protein n=1 Tax=Aquabacter spiritensis TaxID=933073 RepID=A0A4V2UYJ5_9HYPH|nr:phage head-tail connector protein [Aquabacter spiritensis]TCT07628.1 putative phiE125 gp8 family phage protein [Aquabacter spiritensis]